MKDDYILEIENISKEFPGVKALENVNLKVKKGSVHALLGENGAGKSTLMNILIGLYKPDNGQLIFDRERLIVSNVRHAMAMGISMIHQELSPIPNMTVAENIFLGREPTYFIGGFVNKKKLVENTRKLFNRLNIDIDVEKKMSRLSIANMQMVEIAKAISRNSKLIIMDEPTSAITEKEVNHLFEIIKSLKEGVSVIYITHKIDEVWHITDECSVLRDGKSIGTEFTHQLTKDKLIEMMVGRELDQTIVKSQTKREKITLSVKDLTKEGKFNNISFDVHKNEVFGIAGLMGSGRTEILESIFGIFPADSGEIVVNGQKLLISSPRMAIKNGLGYLTEDRNLKGCFLPLSVRENTIIVNINNYSRWGFLNRKSIDDDCNQQKQQLALKTPSFSIPIRNLSGGNQQKVLLSRWLLYDPEILLLDEPTRGIDVGAKSEIHQIIFELAKKGKTIIVVSSEMPEILELCDRILVMHLGKQMGVLSRKEATPEKVMHLAMGSAVNSSG